MAGKKSVKLKIELRTEELAAPVAAEYGVKIYDVDYTKDGEEYSLTVYIDKEGGVTILDCENVSRKLSDLLDEEDLISVPYTLYVSSPGLGRTLTKDRHLANSIGEKVEIRLFRKSDEFGGKELTGILEAFDGETVTVAREAEQGNKMKKGRKAEEGPEQEQDPEAHETVAVARKDIAVIRLALEL